MTEVILTNPDKYTQEFYTALRAAVDVTTKNPDEWSPGISGLRVHKDGYLGSKTGMFLMRFLTTSRRDDAL